MHGHIGQCDARPTVTFPAAEHRRPLTDTKLYSLVTERHMGVGNLPIVVAWQCTRRESNPRPLDHVSDMLTTTSPSQPNTAIICVCVLCCVCGPVGRIGSWDWQLCSITTVREPRLHPWQTTSQVLSQRTRCVPSSSASWLISLRITPSPPHLSSFYTFSTINEILISFLLYMFFLLCYCMGLVAWFNPLSPAPVSTK